MEEIVLPDVLVFDWDEGNNTKSWIKHRVSVDEQEQAFLDKKKRAFWDTKHSETEERFLLFAKTRKGKKAYNCIHKTERKNTLYFSETNE